MKRLVVLFLGILCMCGWQGLRAEDAIAFAVHKVYSDHMVLQRERPIKICGTAPSGQSVTVTLAGNTATATAGEDGEWVATLPALQAGGPHEVVVKNSDGKEVKFSDVLIGEVWICSGQSNMEMPVWGGGQFFRSKNGDEEAKNANFPQIRLFNVTAKKYVSPKGPQKEIVGNGWQVCSPETVPSFSAAGFYFGRQLYNDLKIPVGLVSSSWGGTPIQSWISAEGYKLAGRNGELEQIASADLSPEAQKKLEEKDRSVFGIWQKKFFACGAETTAAAAAWKNPDCDDKDWASVDAGATFPDIDGVVWYRKTVEVPQEWAGKALTLGLGAIDDCDETYFNGVKIGATDVDTPQYWSAKRVYQIPAEQVKGGSAVIAVRVVDYFGGGGMGGSKNEMILYPAGQKDAAVSVGGGWKLKTEFAADIKKIGSRPATSATAGANSPHFPATLYNSMIAPWTLYPVRGAIWYQGESNAGAYQDYMILHPLLIADWRRLWKDPDFAFLCVQLAAFQKHTPANRLPADFWKSLTPADTGNWPMLREVQTATLNVPNTGMAVAIDIGDASDIHPADKQTVGFRLAKEAERICYGLKEVSAGPLYEKMQVEGSKIRLFFTNVGGGLEAKGGDLNTFAIAGEDGKFVWAKAQIDGGNVLVWSDEVAAPKTVRYAWSMFPMNPNLYNKEGFPACPFRTDLPDYLLKKK